MHIQTIIIKIINLGLLKIREGHITHTKRFKTKILNHTKIRDPIENFMHFIEDITNIGSIVVHHKDLINLIAPNFNPNSFKKEPAPKLIPLIMNSINLLMNIIFEKTRTSLLEVMNLFVHD